MNILPNMSSVSYYYQQVEMILIKCSSCLVNILQTKTAKSSHSKFQVLFFDVLVSSFGSQNEIRYKGVLWKMEGNDSTNTSQAPRREIHCIHLLDTVYKVKRSH